jgi:hypothetical protein
LTCGILENFWIGVKNKKQLTFFNSDLVKSTEIAADSNGISDVQINQKSEEVITLS